MSATNSKRDLNSLTARLRRGVWNGLWFGIPLAFFSVLGALIDYETWRQKIGGSPYTIAVFYLVASAAIGALTGAFEKQLRLRSAALGFGFVVMIPTGVAVLLLTKGAEYTVSAKGILVILVVAAVMGPICANIIRAK